MKIVTDIPQTFENVSSWGRAYLARGESEIVECVFERNARVSFPLCVEDKIARVIKCIFSKNCDVVIQGFSELENCTFAQGATISVSLPTNGWSTLRDVKDIYRNISLLDSRGYCFTCWLDESYNVLQITAGCRNFDSIAAAKAYYESEHYDSDGNAKEIKYILNCFKRLIKAYKEV